MIKFSFNVCVNGSSCDIHLGSDDKRLLNVLSSPVVCSHFNSFLGFVFSVYDSSLSDTFVKNLTSDDVETNIFDDMEDCLK